MGLFGRKKKDIVGVETRDSASEELSAVIGAAIAASEDGTRIAVIGAAIAAYEADRVHSDLRIGKIDRTAGCIPAWGVAGNREAIDVRRT
ncbi:MAG: hypothetical protein LBL63_02300 [Clostridiales Family XIII bacterium]|jgi:hypothetical protein|nr:hypothetical protein [Clostridiales Family XIII bacterium]